MGWLRKLMFWRDDEPGVEHVEGYTVDGCFTLPDGSPLTPPAREAADASEPPRGTAPPE